MAGLIPLSDLTRRRGYSLTSDNIYDPTGQTAYGSDGSKVGKVRSVLVDEDTGRIRYLVLDVGNWFSSKEVLVPVGLARIEDDGVYFDSMIKDQVKNMQEYREGMQITDEYQYQNEAALGGSMTGVQTGQSYSYRDDTESSMFRTPQRLQLLEERLIVDKQREKVGEVEISKRVETHPETVNVNLTREEVVIERRPVTDGRPVEGNVTLGADREAIRVDLEAERADVRKQAYVAEEVEISKRQETETKTVTEEVGREVLEVERSGDVRLEGDTSSTQPSAANTRGGRRNDT